MHADSNEDMVVKLQKEPYRGVLNKTCSENMYQIYRETPMQKCDFNKVALQHLFLGTPLDGCL